MKISDSCFMMMSSVQIQSSLRVSINARSFSRLLSGRNVQSRLNGFRNSTGVVSSACASSYSVTTVGLR